MPPKSKKTSLWIKCDVCCVDVPQKDLKSHVESSCENLEKSWIIPFISHGILHSFLEIKDDLNLELVESLIVLHHSAIQLCNFVIGEHVVIKNISVEIPPIVRRIWPSSHNLPTSVSLSTKGLNSLWKNQNKSKISIEPLKTTVYQAYTVNVKVNNYFEDSPEFIDFLQLSQINNIISQSHSFNINFYGRNIKLSVLSISRKINDPEDCEWFLVNNETKWVIHNNDLDGLPSSSPQVCIGGVNNILDDINSIMKIALSEDSHRLGIKIMRSILLYGPSGTGKSSIVNYITETSHASNVYHIKTSDIYSKFYGETESAVKKVFGDALKNSPSIIIIDEIDILCPKRNTSGTEQEKRIISTLATLLDNIHNENNRIFVITCSNKPDMLDPSLRRYGRIDHEIEIPVPDREGRYDIFNKMMHSIKHNLSREEIKIVSDAAHGYVGADIANLCTQASMRVLKNFPTTNEINFSDFQLALKCVNPSAMREVLIDIPNVKWSDIGGQDELKLKLKQAIEWPLKHAESFHRLGIKSPSGILMYGPPGCSKTMIAKAVAHESHLNFLSIKGPELFSKWVGESERAVRELFRKARQVAPSIIFFDEIDALGSERAKNSSGSNVQERILAQLLTELDGISPLGNVTIIAATNRPDKIDSALLRPGRIDRIVYVPLPDESTRLAIFNIKLSKMPFSKEININELVNQTNGYSGAEVNAVCHEAALKALEENINCTEILASHFETALKIIQPRTPLHLLSLYDQFEKRFSL